MAIRESHVSAVFPAVAAAAATAVLVVLPFYTGSVNSQMKSATLIEVNGARAILPLMVPIALTVLPLIFPARWVWTVGAILLTVFVLLGAFSIGLFYAPAAVLMIVQHIRRNAV